jgi:hypothetical protein
VAAGVCTRMMMWIWTLKIVAQRRRAERERAARER